MNKKWTFKLFVLTICSALLFSCSPDKKNENDRVVVWTKSAPSGFNPIINLGKAESLIYGNLYESPVTFNPKTDRMESVLFEAVPTPVSITEGPNKGFPGYSVRFRKDAKWDDGSPVTMADYVFTMKTIKCPAVNAPRFRAFLKVIRDIEVDPDGLGGIVVFQEENMLGVEITGMNPIIPEYFYDPEKALRNVDFETLDSDSLFAISLEKYPSINQFAEQFNKVKINASDISGNGCYQVKSYEPNQYTILQKKPNHWTFGLNNPSLVHQAIPEEIVYAVNTNEVNVEAQLRQGQYTVVPGVSYLNYTKWLADPEISEQYEGAKHPLMHYYYIGLNMRRPVLSQKEVREALRLSCNINAILKSQENGEGERINSPFLLTDEINTLEDISFDLAKAKKVLLEGGWKDSDSDGVLEKVINGKQHRLSMEFVVTGKPLGNFIASLLKQDAAKVGMEINLKTVNKKQLKSIIRGHEFDLMVSRNTMPLTLPDPYVAYHTDNIGPGMGNNWGFGNAESDALIDQIRAEFDREKQLQSYLKLEKIIYDEVPVIFLYQPVERFIFKKGSKPFFSKNRPGFFPKLFGADTNK